MAQAAVAPGRSPSPYMTVAEAAEYLRGGQRTLRRMLAEGRIPYTRPDGKRILVRRDDLDRYLDARRVDPTSAPSCRPLSGR